MNHQPCDNGKPKCSVCTKHNKPCLYLRPTKRRGPQKGYRAALNTYKESAAAWGAVLDAIPGLDALIEGHLRGDAGKSIVASIKDSNRQEALINKWQQSSVFRAFFGRNGPPPTAPAADNAASSQTAAGEENAADETPPARPLPAKRPSQQPASQTSPSASSSAVPEAPAPKPPSAPGPASQQPPDAASLSDLVAKDAAQSYEAPPSPCLASRRSLLTAQQCHESLADARVARFRPRRDDCRFLHHGLQPGADTGVQRPRFRPVSGNRGGAEGLLRASHGPLFSGMRPTGRHFQLV